MSGLGGKRILVLEDESLIAMVLEDILEDFGCTVVGPAYDVPAGEALARDEAIDGAILDLHIGNGSSHSVAELLLARRIPFVVASGSDDPNLLPGAAGTVAKPFSSASVREAVERMLV
jgi:CheY-like chemotaxis protein